MGSFGFDLYSRNITEWKSTGIYNHSSDSNRMLLQTRKLMYLFLKMMVERMFI